MLALGLILVIVAAGGGAYLGWLASHSSTSVTLSGGGLSFAVLPITLLAAGAAAMLLLWLGFRLVGIGFRRRRAQRQELKALRESGATTSRPSDRAVGRETRVTERETGRPSTTERGATQTRATPPERPTRD